MTKQLLIHCGIAAHIDEGHDGDDGRPVGREVQAAPQERGEQKSQNNKKICYTKHSLPDPIFLPLSKLEKKPCLTFVNTFVKIEHGFE